MFCCKAPLAGGGGAPPAPSSLRLRAGECSPPEGCPGRSAQKAEVQGALSLRPKQALLRYLRK